MYFDFDNIDREVVEYDSLFVKNDRLLNCFEDAFRFIEIIRDNFNKYSFEEFKIPEEYNIDVDLLRNIIIESLNFSERFLNSSLNISKKLYNRKIYLELTDNRTELTERGHDEFTIYINVNEHPYYILYSLCCDLYITNSKFVNENIDDLVFNELTEKNYILGEEYAKRFKKYLPVEEHEQILYRHCNLLSDLFDHLETRNDIEIIKQQFIDSTFYKMLLDNLYVSQFIKNMNKTEFMKGFEKEFNTKDYKYIGRDEHAFVSYKRIRKLIPARINKYYKIFLNILFRTYNKNYTYDFIKGDFNFSLIDFDSFLDNHENYLYVRHYEYCGKYQQKYHITPGHERYGLGCHWWLDEEYSIRRKLTDEQYREWKRKKYVEEFVEEIFDRL